MAQGRLHRPRQRIDRDPRRRALSSSWSNRAAAAPALSAQSRERFSLRRRRPISGLICDHHRRDPMPIAAPRPETWIRTTPAGLYCEPGDFHIDPSAPGAARRDHPRPRRSRAPRQCAGAGNRARPSRSCRRAMAKTPAGRCSRFAYGESLTVGEVTSAAGAGRSCARQRADRARLPRQSGRCFRRLQAPARSDLRAVRAAELRPVHHRGDLRPAGLPPSAGRSGDRQAIAFADAVPRALPSRRSLRARQMPARLGAAAPRRATRNRFICTAR